MIYLDQMFQDKKLNIQRLLAYGFKEEDGSYQYKTDILNGDFELIMSVDEDKVFDYKVIDNMTEEEYSLVKTSACGGFVGDVRTACKENILNVIDKCYDDYVFKSTQAQAAIGYIRDVFKREAEFLWQKQSGTAVFRQPNAKNKWFAVMTKVDASKIDPDRSGEIEIMCLKNYPDHIVRLIDEGKAVPAYHMNKKHWCTIELNGEMASDGELFSFINISFLLTIVRNSKTKRGI